MNLAVHGLEENIQKAISYYEDPQNFIGQADFLMANPPFNMDEINAQTIKDDPRLPFVLPDVNKSKKVSNGNYVWMSFFHSYLSEPVNEGKNNGLIVDYCGILKKLKEGVGDICRVYGRGR